MEISKLSFFRKTKEALADNPILTPPSLNLSLLQQEAQDFAWRKNSDSLRDFIADLNEQERIKRK